MGLRKYLSRIFRRDCQVKTRISISQAIYPDIVASAKAASVVTSAQTSPVDNDVSQTSSVHGAISPSSSIHDNIDNVADPSHSSFPPIPAEIMIDILSRLSPHDLISCRRVNRALNSIIHNSVRLQHQIDQAIAGVMDNPYSSLSLPDRRAALARRQEAWDTCRPQYMVSTKASQARWGIPDVIQSGIYFRIWVTSPESDSRDSVLYRPAPQPNETFSGTWSCLNLKGERHARIMGLAVCLEENDLVAVGIQHGRHLPYSFEVDLLCFSSGGGEHPSAEASTLLVKHVKNPGGWDMKMEIRENLLVILLRSSDIWTASQVDGELWVFDWKTGGKVASLKGQGVDACRFLSNKLMVVGNRTTPALELFTLPVLPNDGTCSTPMIKLAALGFPTLANGCRLVRMQFCNLPAKNGVARNNNLHDTDIHVKPFIGTSPDDIIYVSLTLTSGPYEVAAISFFVHSSALRRCARIHAVSLQDTIPWNQWGPTVTRWHHGGIFPSTRFCGQRCLSPSSHAIWDFNQHRVRRLGKGFVAESETTRLSVETEPSYLNSWVLEKQIFSSLPYVKIVPKGWFLRSATCLDDDRVFGCRDLGYGKYEAKYFYFG